MYKVNIESKKYEEKEILKDLVFEFRKEEFLGIIGPSGCGKTTLLGILSKLDKDFEGEIDINAQNISYVFQDDRLIPWLSIKENLLLVSKTKDLEEIKELLKLVKLENILEEYPNKLSGGMKKRVAFIRAFINSPDFILLDEPFSSLDFPTSQDLKEEFLKLCSKFKPTVVLVTHDISEAIYLCSKIVFLSKSPSKAIYEYENTNNQEFNLKNIDYLKNEIFEKYPNILKGEI